MHRWLIIIVLTSLFALVGCEIFSSSIHTEKKENIQNRQEVKENVQSQEKVDGNIKTTVTQTERTTITTEEMVTYENKKKSTEVPVENVSGILSTFLGGGSGMWLNLLIGLLGGVGTGLAGYISKKDVSTGKMLDFKWSEVLEDVLTGLGAGGIATISGLDMANPIPQAHGLLGVILPILTTWGLVEGTGTTWKISWRNILTRALPTVLNWLKPKQNT